MLPHRPVWQEATIVAMDFTSSDAKWLLIYECLSNLSDFIIYVEMSSGYAVRVSSLDQSIAIVGKMDHAITEETLNHLQKDDSIWKYAEQYGRIYVQQWSFRTEKTQGHLCMEFAALLRLKTAVNTVLFEAGKILSHARNENYKFNAE